MEQFRHGRVGHALIDIIASATPALYNAFASAMPLFGTDAEPTMIEKLYALLGETNFSDRVLALVPERLAVLKVSGIKWNDLGSRSAFASIQPAAARPPGWKTTEAVRQSVRVRRVFAAD